jgi:hypothetical protein
MKRTILALPAFVAGWLIISSLSLTGPYAAELQTIREIKH